MSCFKRVWCFFLITGLASLPAAAQTTFATIRDGYFGNRCPRGADLMLVNTDAEDDTFHMLELTRQTGDRKGFWGSE